MEDKVQLQKAVALYQQGRISDAGSIYTQLIKNNPENYDALHYYGILKASLGELPEAKKLIKQSLASSEKYIPYLENYVTILFQAGEYKSASQLSAKAISENTSTETLQYIQAVSLYKLERFHEAIEAFDRLLRRAPNSLIAHNEKAAALGELGAYDEAILHVEKALKIDPQYPEALLNKANILFKMAKYEVALKLYQQTLTLSQNLPEAYLGWGNALGRLNRHNDALAAYDKALALKPKFTKAWLNSGNSFTELRRYQEALSAYDKALGTKPDYAEAWHGRGKVFYDLKRYDEAFVAFDKALSIKPDLDSVEGARLYCKMNLCDWSNFAFECENLISSIKSNKANAEPFSLLAITASPEDQFQYAKVWAAKKHPPVDKQVWHGEIYKHARIRVAYVSADFHQHATSVLMAGMFECHDKSRFELSAISIGIDDTSEMRRRLERSFDKFISVREFSDEAVAAWIKKEEIDILVDLKGYTQHARTDIFSYRSAPIQINYLGYPGTMGADYIDYLIGDQTVIPQSHQGYYTEKIIYLPNSYQVNDAKRAISDTVCTRSQMGLPQKAFVFCCFNNNYKILPDMFDCWMRILKAVDGSVLWLFEANPFAASN